MERVNATSEARQRILETADRLFYREGVRGVGIDRIIAEAGVAKMSLYKHFPSKDDLIPAVLKYREEQVLTFFASAMERHEKRTKDKLRAFFAALKDWFESPGLPGLCVPERRGGVGGPGPRRHRVRPGPQAAVPGVPCGARRGIARPGCGGGRPRRRPARGRGHCDGRDSGGVRPGRRGP